MKYIKILTTAFTSVMLIFLLFLFSNFESINPNNGDVISETDELFQVIDVTDGDTIKISYKGNIEKVRLLGIDTPERDECYFEESTEELEDLVMDESVRIEFDSTQGDRDRFGRLLLYIWVGDTFINEEMIKKGFAHEYTYNLPYKYQKQFKLIEDFAREKEIGLWGAACEL